MKSLALIACAALMSAGTAVSSAEPEQPAGRERAVMLYFSKSLGGSQRQNHAPLAFGLRLQQSSPFQDNQQVSLLDARVSLDGRKQMLFGGLNAFDSKKDIDIDADGTGSSSEGAWFREHKLMTGLLATLIVVGGLCGARTVICEKNSGYRVGDETAPGDN
jgi:hypothetical protein